jgi:cytidylate kinase-like protein
VTDSFQSLEKAHSWALFDQNIVKAVLEDQGLSKHLEEFIKEDGKPALEDAFEELLGLHPSTPALVQSVTRTILKLANAGGVVLIGRGAHMVCAKLPMLSTSAWSHPLSRACSTLQIISS